MNKASPQPSAKLWSTFRISDDRTYHWVNGPLQLWARLRHNDLHLALQRQDSQEGPWTVVEAETVEPEDDLEWQRWAMPDDNPKLHFRPVMPDRPIVVRPEAPLVIPPGVTCIFYAMMPIWVELLQGDDPAALQTITKLPHVILSNTWFGDDTMSGVLCYGMRTTARRNRQELPFRPHRATCAIKVVNDSEDHLECTRFCIRVEHMSLYLRDNSLFTSAVEIAYRGQERGQRLSYHEKRPDDTHLGELISPASEPVRGSLLSKSIASIRITNFLRPDWL